MTMPFIGEVRIFAGNFPPRGWIPCDGQILLIEQNRALFSLLGAVYGGDGETTFGIPDLRDSVPIGQGQGQGLRNRNLGDSGGGNTVVLSELELPRHSHAFNVSNNDADTNTGARPANQYLAKGAYDNGGNAGVVAYYSTAAADVAMSPAAAAKAGASAPHNTMMPSLGMYFIIATQGIFPGRP